jgi:small subunit ribosomal protein S1
MNQVIFQDVNQSTGPSFAELFNESVQNTDFKTGTLLSAKVVKVTPEYVLVDAGFKSESRIPLNEFKDHSGRVAVAVDDTVDVVLDTLENGAGETKLSREKAKRLETFNRLAACYDTQESVFGIITERVRGGFTVEIDKLKAFLPGSLLDVRPVKDVPMDGKELEFKVVKVDQKTHNIVVSRRAVLLAESNAERAALLGNMKEGDVVTGTVKNITDYGAFIDLGGVDGLLHITDMSWKRVKHPSELVKLGSEIQVKILRFDREKNRVSLGIKQLAEDPWQNITRRYPVRSRIFGKITNITDYGFFVEIEPGIEGLVHMSEIDWTNKNVNPTKSVTPGQEVEVMVLEIDPARRRISLGMKQCIANPWEEFAANHKKGDKIAAKIRSITDFGLFLGLDGNIDGLVHLSDLSWSEPGEQAISKYEKGQEVEAVILAIDSERERISLGIKQLQGDIYSDYLTSNPKGTVVKGKVTEVTPKFAVVDLGENIVGRVKASDASRMTVKNVANFLAVGDEIEAKVMGFDKKSRQVNLSIKELQPDITGANAPGNTQLGDLLKEMGSEDSGAAGSEGGESAE